MCVGWWESVQACVCARVCMCEQKWGGVFWVCVYGRGNVYEMHVWMRPWGGQWGDF